MDKNKKELTEKELKRKNDFEKLSSEMQQKGYKVKNVTINTQKAKYLALFVMLPFMALAFWLYNNVNGFNLDGPSFLKTPKKVHKSFRDPCIRTKEVFPSIKK